MKSNFCRLRVILQCQLLLLLLTTAISGQAPPTPGQLDTLRVIEGRIRSNSDAEVATLRTQQLVQAQVFEQRTELRRNGLAEEIAQVTGRIEILNLLLQDFSRIRGNMDQVGVQLRASYQRQLDLANQQLRTLRQQLIGATTDLSTARQRRLDVEKVLVSKQAKNTQLLDDLGNLLRTWQQAPARCTGEAVRDRYIEVARSRQLGSRVTITTGSVPVTVRYRLVSGGQISSRANCTQCVITLPVGYYNFWVDRTGLTTPQTREFLVFQDNHTLDLR